MTTFHAEGPLDRGADVARFAMLGRRPTARSAYPSGFEAVGEALASGHDPAEACAVAGRELAVDGISVAEALTDLRATWLRVRGTDPPYAALSALVVAPGPTPRWPTSTTCPARTR
ncbi:hypothetical protein [Nocardioides sp. B-3]|uniref:hypothetical protein n=1 Tax=Nocardioides sp. B-3 TaxID=2895565 RepID=UPI00215217E0|nr:hypothetical protein [Nocardioides sp. B-3]UUZ58309.1 hypothetical protein LP418_19085 [Nocardioides sp. B-3]